MLLSMSGNTQYDDCVVVVDDDDDDDDNDDVNLFTYWAETDVLFLIISYEYHHPVNYNHILFPYTDM